MKIIFANRSNCLSSPGGDTVQMLKTMESLQEKYNIDVSICLSPNDILKDKDSSPVVHIFNMQTIDETLEFMKVSKDAGKKVVLSTIYWDLSHSVCVTKMYQLFGITNGIKYIKYLKGLFLKMAFLKGYIPKYRNADVFGTKNYKKKRRRALLEADIILPNSNEELDIICEEFSLDKKELNKKAVIIPNAVDIKQNKNRVINADNKSVIFNNVKDFVLEVARIEVNKNQYGIVKALFDIPEIPIVFIGGVRDNITDINYYKKLKEVSATRGNVYFVDQLPQELVFEYYKNARVHALPSFRESPGLSSLEALYFGCEIVTSSSNFCPVEYYKFSKKAHMCDPYSYKSIRKAILEAYESPKNTSFDDEYFKFYSYDNVAFLMKQIYCSLIK